MTDRLTEIMTLASCGDEDVALQVESEVALMPETREERIRQAMEHADEVAASFAPIAAPVSAEELAKLAEDADF